MASPVTPNIAILPKPSATVVKYVEPSKTKPGSGASKSPARFTPGHSPSGKYPGLHSSPSKLLPGLSSPRKSIFGKSVGQLGGIKLGSAQSPSKVFFGKSPSGMKAAGLGQFDLPLALRKKRRPNAGMKREPHLDEDKILSVPKQQKDGKMPSKRKLSQSSPNSSSGKMNVKLKEDYVPPSSKKRKIVRSNRDQDSRNDFYCWVCHKEGSVICCELCPRVYHPKCAKLEGDPYGDWFCPECERATNAECVDSQSKAMASLTLDQLAKLLLFALKRMRHSGAEPFLKPVNLQQNPGYEEFVFNPMDLSTLEKNIKKRMYGSTEAFLLDAKWILHNCIVFNGSHHKLTNSARMIIKICEYEVKEIEICPDCYLSACLKRDKWFCEVCRDPHKLVWARLQGFPFWPSKVIREKDGQLDVRFFGQHDRAWVPIGSCFMYSSEIPCQPKKKATGLSSSVAEMELHIQHLQKTFGKECFQYAPNRTPYGKMECLSINAGDRQKWQGSRMAMGSFINGIHERSSPKPEASSTMEIKTEPVDVESVISEETAANEKRSEAAPNRPETVLEHDTNGAATTGKHQELTDETSVSVSDNNNGAARSGTISPDKIASQNSTLNPMRLQVYTVARKRMGRVKERTSANKTDTGATDVLTGSPSKEKMTDGDSRGSDNSGASSPSKAPVGVFEVSDESLDVDPDVEAQSPSAQLLGRSLAIKLSKVSPKSLGKMCRLEIKGEGIASKELDEEDTCDQDNPFREANMNPKNINPMLEESKISGDLDTTRYSKSGVEKTESTSRKNSAKTQSSDSESGDSLEKLNPDEDVPSTSQSTPTKDKFHIKLRKTIESMKMSLGIERLHSVEKETSDSESSDSESDSSEADHSEESEMEVDDEQHDAVDKIGEGSQTKGELGEKTEIGKDNRKETSDDQHQGDQLRVQCVESDGRGTSVSSDQMNSAPPASNTSVSVDESVEDAKVEGPKDTARSGTSKEKSTKAPRNEPALIDSDMDLVMSCHSEMSDSEQGDLVIDENRTVSGRMETRLPTVTSITTKTKESICGKGDLQADVDKIHIRDDYQPPMDMDDVILVSNPFEKKDEKNDQQEKMETADTEKPAVQEQESRSNTTEKQDTPEETPSPSNPPSSNEQLESVVTTNSLSNAPCKPYVHSVDPAQTPEAPQSSSFPRIVETLKASKREIQILPKKSDEDTSKKKTVLLVADKEVEKKPAKVITQQETDKTTETTSKSNFYNKYIEKISTVVEGVLNDFTKDMTDGMLLKDAKNSIDDLKMEVQRLRWEREQEKTEYKQIMDLAIAEMKECMEAEAKVAMENLKSKLETEKREEIRKTKMKQWCAMCGKDAVFFCCWNTSYCDYPCQQTHWPAHRNSCQQRASGNTVIQVQQLQNKHQQPSQQVQMQVRPGMQPIQQQMNQSAASQPIHHSVQQQVQHVMQQPPASSQPMQTLIQYVQAPRMSAPVPVPQLINHHPYMTAGRMVGAGGLRIVRP